MKKLFDNIYYVQMEKYYIAFSVHYPIQQKNRWHHTLVTIILL